MLPDFVWNSSNLERIVENFFHVVIVSRLPCNAMIRPRFPVVTALFSSNRLKKKKKEERKKKEKEREKKKKRKKKFTGDNETNRARVIYRGLIHRYPGTILDDFSPTDCRSIVEIRLIPTYRSPLATGNFPLEIGEKIVAASRKKAKKRGKFRATS